MKPPKEPCSLNEWIATIYVGLIGRGWKKPSTRRAEFKAWRKSYRAEQEYAKLLAEGRRLAAERTRLCFARAESLAPVPPAVYHGDTPSKEPVVTMPQQDAFPPPMDQLANPTSVIYLFVLLEDSGGNWKVVRANSEDPVIPSDADDVSAPDDYGTFASQDRAKAVAKKLNDEERARRFA